MMPLDISINPHLDVDGVQRPTTNSESDPIHWCIEGVMNFWRWFGDSRAVDTHGRPLVVYHGGYKAAEITEFKSDYGGHHTGNNDRGAFYFTNEREVAEDYSRAAFVSWHERELAMDEKEAASLAEKHISVFAAYLKLENPVEEDHNCEVIKMEEHEHLAEFAMNSKDDDGKFYDLYRLVVSYEPSDIEEMREEIERYARSEYGLEESDEIEQWQFDMAVEVVMHNNGYTPTERRIDGLIMRNVVDNISDKSYIPADNFVVFDPCSIKSVHNSGMFLPWSADVRDPNSDFDPPVAVTRKKRKP